MKKEEQKTINYLAVNHYEMARKEIGPICASYSKRLRSCSAYVYETDNYYLLRSYNTIVAVIDKSTDTCVDVLRYTYGYTSTSAHHIAKFRHDYGAGKWGCEQSLVYRQI